MPKNSSAAGRRKRIGNDSERKRAAQLRKGGRLHGDTSNRDVSLDGVGIPRLPGQEPPKPRDRPKPGSRKKEEGNKLGSTYRPEGLRRLPKSMK